MYSEADLLPLSALQHFLYCPRQCALIHIEQQWGENRFTAEGRAQHDRVDRRESEIRDGVRMEYAVPLRSLRLGLSGIADVVEFHSDLKSEILNLKSPVRAYPVEHKRGKPKPSDCDRVQLCAQAMCLEEMLNTEIPEGAIFYGQPRRREVVLFTPQLREETERTVTGVHELLESGKTPSAEYNEKKCTACSLLDICMPRVRKNASAYLREIIDEKIS
ncbi:MAG TPA: CRISPR-associated protein Cas4 [Kiritimatiellia bacterium]|nr:CRISPR-associated protein Cas4 [Kiritimatiellia bacterium]HQQ04557.1 CRISPR-associated protein Cas4 [Kiritimatiellia bacterium]